MVDAESEADQEISGGVLADLLDNYGEGREGEGADHGGGFLELELLLGQQLPLTGTPCGVQLGPCHDLSAWLLSSSYVDWGGVHGSHGEGYHGSHGEGYHV